jgi:hypothetical protein
MVCHVLVSANLLVGGVVAIGQEPSRLPDAPSASQNQSSPSGVAQSVPQHEASKNHIFWIIPNYRSDENSAEIKPLTPAEKMKVHWTTLSIPQRFWWLASLPGYRWRGSSTAPSERERRDLANITEEHLQIKQLATS